MFSIIDANNFEDSKFSKYIYELISKENFLNTGFPNLGTEDILEEYEGNNGYKKYIKDKFAEGRTEDSLSLAVWYFNVKSEIEYYQSFYSEAGFEKRYYQALGMSLRGYSDEDVEKKIFSVKDVEYEGYAMYIIEVEITNLKSEHSKFLLKSLKELKKLDEEKDPLELEIYHWKRKKRIFLNEYPKRISPLAEDDFFFDRTNYKALLKMVKEYKTYKNKIPIESLINELPKKYTKEANTPKSIRLNIPLYKDWSKLMDKHPKLKQEHKGDQVNLSLHWAMEILKKDLEIE